MQYLETNALRIFAAVASPAHIEPRFTAEQINPRIQVLTARIAELEAELRSLRGDSEALSNPVGSIRPLKRRNES